jgi:hypothetical protein
MSDYLNQMRTAKETFRTALHEFLKICDPLQEPNKVYCFVEAEADKIFYNTKIIGIANISPYTFICNNKNNVISIFNDLRTRSTYRTVKKGFFIDRDFELNILPKEIFVTPYHSLESFYVQLDTVEVILEDIFKFSKDSKNFIKAMGSFKRLSGIFHEKVLLLNVFLCCQAVLYDPSKEVHLHVDNKMDKIFDNIVLKDLAGISDLDSINTKEKIETIFQTVVIGEDLWERKKLEFEKANASQVFRGKFELKFLFSFIKRLKETMEDKSQTDWEKQSKKSLPINYEQVLHVLPGKVIIPISLRSYILSIVDE